MVHRMLRKPRRNSRPRSKQLTLESRAPQIMDCPAPFHCNEASEGSSSIAPQAPCRRVYNLSNTTSQLPHSDRQPGSQSVPSEDPEQLPELLSWQAHPLDPQYPELSASSLQAPSSRTPSTYAPGRSQQVSARLESETFEQYVASQTSNRYHLPSSYFEAWPTHNGDGSSLASIDASGRQSVQESSIDNHNLSAEESNEFLSEMGSWNSPRVLGGASVLDNYHRPDGPTINPSQTWNPVPMENNPARQDQGTHLQEIDYPIDPSALGIDQSLQPPYFPEMHGSFVADANNTNTDAWDSRNEEYPHDLGYLGNQGLSNPSALAPNYAPESRNILSSIEPNSTPPFDHGAHIQLAPESSERCQICNKPFSNSENRRRHMRELHREKFQYICQLDKDGSVCSANVNLARNRRRHVEAVHPRESAELPPTSTNRRPNDKTDEMLNKWFQEVQQ